MISLPAGQSTVTSFTYEAATGSLLIQTETGYSEGNPVSRTITYTYNVRGQVTSVDGPRADVADITTLEYYPNDPAEGLNRGMLKKTIDALGHETTYSQYNAFGKTETITDPNGVATAYVYDGLGRLTSKTTNGSITSFEYDALGNQTTVHLPAGRDIIYTYTSANFLEKAEDSLGNYILYFYDTEGNRTREEIHDTDGVLKKYTDFEFDDYNRFKKAIYPGGLFEERAYDDNGNLLSIKDADSRTTAYSYDPLNRLINVTQPGSVITGYVYDSHDNLISVTDAENHTTTYTYDDLGRQISESSPDSNTTGYTYNASGNLLSKTDAIGNTVSYTYDVLNRLTAIHYPDSAQDVTYTYDEGVNFKGRLTGMTDPSGTYLYSYDALGNFITEEKTIEEVPYVTQYTYDAAGILNGIIYPNGRTVTYGLDSAGRVKTVTTAKDSTTQTLAENITYLPFGPLHGLTYGNGTAMTQGFDQRYRLTGLSAGSIQNLAYTLDPVGNITAITNNLDPTRSQTFGYDDLYRLTSSNGIYGDISYTYDKVGNRLTRIEGTQTDTYSYVNGTSKLSQITGANPQSFSHDLNGNTTETGSKSLTYNQNNRLIQISENSTALGVYTYNANGQRIKKMAGDSTTIYHYDRLGNLIGESTPEGEFIVDYIYLGSTRLAAIAWVAPEEITVHVSTSKDRNLSGINVYAFDENDAYTGKRALTDESGIAQFSPDDFAAGAYKFRADYLAYQFWSDLISLPGMYSTGIQISEETTTFQVSQGGSPKQGVRVYLFNANGSYLGLCETTDENGEVTFDLPSGMDYKFRADILGNQYFSDIITIIAGGANNYAINTGGGSLTITVDNGEEMGIEDLNIYLFNRQGTYLGLSDQTDSQGQGSFDVSSGTYKVRCDYMGYQFWSQETTVIENDNVLLSIPHQDVTITVDRDYNGDVVPGADLMMYLFMSSGSYLSKSQVTDAAGEVSFNLPQMDYKVRADDMSRQYWSEVFNWTDEIIRINEGIANVTVTNMGLPVEGINVYVFNSTGSYLGINDVTDVNGLVSFRLPVGEYNFRGDYMSNQYWSGISTLIGHVENPINIPTGGGSFSLTVLKALDDPLIGINCYQFNESGTYLGEQGITNDTGSVGFNLADGSYQIRVDYLGYQFWTDIFDIPGTESIVHTIPHQDVTVTVQRDYDGNVAPGENLNVYLFTPSGTYLGLQ